MKSKIRYLISALIIALIAMNCSAQDTLFLNGTNKVTKNLSKSVSYYFINCKLWPTASTSTIRTISGVGKVTFTATGSVSFTPTSSNYVGVWTYHLTDCDLTKRSLVVMKKPVAPPTDTVVYIPAPSNSYILSTASNTSAGVYLLDGTLVRTLWTNKKQNAGTYTVAWDGNDDYGVPVTLPTQKKVISQSITDTWYKHIGNSSSESAARHSRHRGLRGIFDAVEFNGYLYYCTGLPEGESTTKKSSLTDLTTVVEVMPSQYGNINQGTFFLATDGQKVYHGGTDAYNNPLSFVYATDINDAEVLFSAGESVTMTWGRTYPKAIDVKYDNNPITGLAVGSYLYVAHTTGISIINKSTGALISSQNLNLTDLCIDGSFLYGISGNNVNKFTIGSNGALGYVSSTTYAKKPIAISVVGGVIEVSYGFNDFNQYFLRGFITKGANGTWYGDATQIIRKQNGIENGKISYLPMLYNVCVDRNNPTRVFANWVEYSVNYTDMSWTIVKNWFPQLTAPYLPLNDANYNVKGFAPMDVVTVNGRTLALATYFNIDNSRGLAVVELGNSITTVRSFGDWSNISLDVNGDVIEFVNNSFVRHVYNGTNYNAPTTISIVPNMDVQGAPQYDISHTNGAIVYQPEMKWDGRHLGEVRNGKWLYKVAPSYNYPYSSNAYYPTSDTFPTGFFPDDMQGGRQGYAGGKVYTYDGYVVTGYAGEFWNGSGGQVNKWNFYKDGLMFYQWGVTAWDGNDGAKMAGNNYMGTFYKVGNYYYLAYSDESWWGAIQIVKLDFSSIKTQIVAQ